MIEAKLYKLALICTSALVPLLAPQIASAQAAPAARAPAAADSSNTLAEVVVTANRREESTQKVAVSVAAYTQRRLDQQGVRSIDDISSLTPGISFARTDGRNPAANNIAIRGISSTVASSTTGVYIDDTPIQTRIIGAGAANFNAYPNIFDLDRVEVLRGPQGTLFGAGSEGGTIRFLTPKPSLTTMSSYARAEAAETEGGGPSYEGGVAVGGPIVEDKLAFRISGWMRHDGGYIDRVNTDPQPGDAPLAVFNNSPGLPPTVLPQRTTVNYVAEKNTNYQDSQVAKAALLYRPIDKLEILGSFYYQNSYYNDSNVYWESLSNPSNNQYAQGSAIGQPTKDRFWLPSLSINYDAGPVRFVSSTSYFHRNENSINDYTAFESALWAHYWEYPVGMSAPTLQVNNQEGWTQEFRMESANPDARVKWVTGVFYQYNTQLARQLVQDTFLPNLFANVNGVPFAVAFGQGLAGGRYTFDEDPVITHDEQIALFGQADIKLTDQLTFTAGVRGEEAKFDANANYVGPVVGPPVHDTGAKTEYPVTPKFGLSWQATQNNLLYATASKGFRIGGYNPQVGLPCAATLAALGYQTSPGNATGRPASFNSDTLWSYEVGAKNTLDGGRARVNVSGYYIDWQNIQQGVGLAACGFGFTANLGSAVSQGFDLDGDFRLTDQITVGGAVGYNDARFTQTVNLNHAPYNLVTSGDRLPGAPLTVTLNGQYNFRLFDRSSYIRFDYQYHSRGPDNTSTLDLKNRPPIPPADPGVLIPTPETHELSMRGGMDFGPVNASIFVKNLLDQHPNLTRADLAFQPTTAGGTDRPNYTGQTLRPRTIGLTFVARY